ncbi:MAG: DUF373 family protein [Methanosarcinaceae archaeon]|nr:DUF373 family protein [Methanosarcinaceae archaeon]
MQTLVICIDRDDDLGEKAKVKTPLIGKEQNIAAAVKLATADPEDSDTNTIFGGIKVLDELKEIGIDAEIVTFAGDKNVGIISDQKITEQLENILESFDAKNAIFISDGAEDETLIPIVQSRIKINSVKRIVVKQSANLESTYYILKNAFNDPKISQTFFVPLGLTAMIYAIFLLAKYPEGAIIGISAAIGLYMLYRGFNLDEWVVVMKEKLKTEFYAGRITFVTYSAAVLITIIATMLGTIELWGYYTTGGIWYYGAVTFFTVFINTTIWWYVIALVFATTGKILDHHISKDFTTKDLSPPLFILSIGLLLWGSSRYILSISNIANDVSVSSEFGLPYFIYSVVLAIIIALVGIRLESMGRSADNCKNKDAKTNED